MARHFLFLAVVCAALAGCSVAPPSAYTYDPTHPQPKPALDAARAAPLTNRIAQLELELNAVRAKIAAQPDTWQRLALYGEEHRIHRELGPLERELSQYASAR
jgi:hypothetical protein